MTFTPLNSHLLVLDIPMEQTIEGVLLPDTSKENIYFSKVLKVGADIKHVAANDIIVRGMYSGIPIILEGVEFSLIREGECLGKVEL